MYQNKEFPNIVTFEEVAPHIGNMYPEAKDYLGWFKLHDDMLKQMTPKRHDDIFDYNSDLGQQIEITVVATDISVSK